MIPEYLFKQAEREANAAMMKELYAEGGMDPAVAGMDPEEIDPEVAAAINDILMQLGNKQGEVPEDDSESFETGEADENDEQDEKHTVEKASALLPLFQKVAEKDDDPEVTTVLDRMNMQLEHELHPDDPDVYHGKPYNKNYYRQLVEEQPRNENSAEPESVVEQKYNSFAPIIDPYKEYNSKPFQNKYPMKGLRGIIDSDPRLRNAESKQEEHYSPGFNGILQRVNDATNVNDIMFSKGGVADSLGELQQESFKRVSDSIPNMIQNW